MSTDKKPAASPEELTLRDKFALGVANHNANLFLNAYKVDGNPWHIVDAFLAYLTAHPSEPDERLATLANALAALKAAAYAGKPIRPPKRNSVRDAELLRIFEALWDANERGGALEQWTKDAIAKRIGEQHGLPAGAKVQIGRARKKISDRAARRAAPQLHNVFAGKKKQN